TRLPDSARSFKEAGFAGALRRAAFQPVADLLHLRPQAAGVAQHREGLGLDPPRQPARLGGDLRESRFQVGPALAPHLLPDGGQELPEALDHVAGLVLWGARWARGRARQGVAQQLLQVAGVLLEVLQALAVQGRVVLLVRLLG